MLHVSGAPLFTPTREMLQEDVGDSICENHTRLGELTATDVGLPLGHNVTRRLDVPSPTQIGPAAHPSSKGQQTVPEEDASFDKMRKSVKNFDTSLHVLC